MTDYGQPKTIAICEHIKDDNSRCGSPALRGHHFCYFHSRSRSARRVDGKLKFQVGALDTYHSVSLVVAQLTQAVLDDEISPTKANTLVRVLRLAQTVVSSAGSPFKQQLDLPASMSDLLNEGSTGDLDAADTAATGASNSDERNGAEIHVERAHSDALASRGQNIQEPLASGTVQSPDRQERKSGELPLPSGALKIPPSPSTPASTPLVRRPPTFERFCEELQKLTYIPLDLRVARAKYEEALKTYAEEPVAS